MGKYGSEYLRRSFLDFFAAKGHKMVESSPLVPDDPTLLFTSAGMVQFKAYYSDPESAPYPTAASVQKCLRAGGKQSDLENVGRTLRHHTFFEMLGNFSFGDYFKQGAIDYAWELIIDVWEMDRERIWISVYEDDDEAYDLWSRRIGVPAKRIVRLGKKDNFWGPVGETGVCGPSSEIYCDTGRSRGCAKKTCRPGCDCDRYIEIWNLVFPQFYLNERGIYDPLPRPGIDTGMGLERVAFILQQVEDNFHTDLFLPIREAIVKDLPQLRGKAEASTALNVCADHIRALCFTMSEGIIPSNEGRGYILRRLLRRSLTKMHPFGVKEPFLAGAVDAVAEVMGERYPEVRERREFIKKVVTAEEQRFLSTLEQGLNRLRNLIDKCKKDSSRVLSGRDAFVLYDTFGFPPELTSELAVEAGLSVDMNGYAEAMAEQKEKGRSVSFHLEGFDAKDRELVRLKELKETSFSGYDALSCDSSVVAFSVIEEEKGKQGGAAGKKLIELVTEETVFYPEGGGQVGDKGVISCGGVSFRVLDTYRLNGTIAHLAVLPPDIGAGSEEAGLRELFGSNACRLDVDRELRNSTARNHTATHLLHAALREVLGKHVVQSGSLVSPERLRFDFSHFQALSHREVEAIEEFVNRAILADIEVVAREMPYREALNSGVMALFGEKYGDVVRVIEVPGTSRELCGGTHVERTGNIGMFLIRHESAVSAGIRRIEALTGQGALAYVRELTSSRESLAGILKASPDEIEERIKSLVDEAGELKRKTASLEQRIVSWTVERAVAAAVTVSGLSMASLEIEGDDIAVLRRAGDLLREKLDRGIGLLLLRHPEKPMMLVVVSEKLLDEKKVDARKIVGHLCEKMSLRGGGKPHMAQAGLREADEFGKIEKLVKDFIGSA
jgi:alanyl-tRNA synthetase